MYLALVMYLASIVGFLLIYVALCLWWWLVDLEQYVFSSLKKAKTWKIKKNKFSIVPHEKIC